MQLLEFQHRYVTDVLSDSKVYAEHAGKSHIDVDDVRLAIQSRVTFSFTQPPPREVCSLVFQCRIASLLRGVIGEHGITLKPARGNSLAYVLMCIRFLKSLHVASYLGV